MIYYGGKMLDLKAEKLTRMAKEVSDEITDIKNKHFSGTGKGRIILRYPNGERKEKDDGFTVLKMFPIPLNSSDGMWRYSETKMLPTGKYADSGHLGIKDRHVFRKKDVEFVWFLLNRSSVLNKYVFIEDLEEEAKEENESLASDAYIRFMLMDKHSPIYSNNKLIRETAEVFGLRDIEKLGKEEVKKALYKLVVDGESINDRFVNFDKFDELVKGEIKRKSAYFARASINDGTVGYKSYAWYLMAGRDFDEKLCTISQKEAAFKEQAFIEEVIENASVRSRLFSAIGQEEITTASDLWDLTLPVLKNKLKEETEEWNPKHNKEDVVTKLCEVYEIEYSPK